MGRPAVVALAVCIALALSVPRAYALAVPLADTAEPAGASQRESGRLPGGCGACIFREAGTASGYCGCLVVCSVPGDSCPEVYVVVIRAQALAEGGQDQVFVYRCRQEPGRLHAGRRLAGGIGRLLGW